MTGEVKISTWDLAAGQHVRLVIAPGVSVCGKVTEADHRRVGLSPCHCYPWEFWIRFWRGDILAAYKQLAFEKCERWQIAFTGERCKAVFGKAT